MHNPHVPQGWYIASFVPSLRTHWQGACAWVQQRGPLLKRIAVAKHDCDCLYTCMGVLQDTQVFASQVMSGHCRSMSGMMHATAVKNSRMH